MAHIAEVDERRLYAREASPSMFAYCTDILHLSEPEAYLRIAAARASREHPILLAMLGDGRLHLTGIAKLAPHLTGENRDALLARATHKSKRRIEELIAEIAPRPDVPAVMRKLPARRNLVPAPAALSHDAESVAPATQLRPDGVGPAIQLGPDAAAFSAGAPAAPSIPLAVVLPLAPDRYKVQFTASARLRDKLERLQALMRPQLPDGDLAAIIEQAVTEKLERIEAKRFGGTSAPRKGLSETETTPASRHLPVAVRRAVRERDGNRCGYVDAQGHRCPETDRLEYHHRRPFAFGGDHGPQNIGLMCGTHNAYLAEHDYGKATMTRSRRSETRAADKSGAGRSPLASGGF
ncbi:MAG TPA: hypothetical protein VI589_11300 [Vicinamibacteria bacterium]